MSLALSTTRSADPAELAAAFKKEVGKSIFSIIAFIVVYLLLILLAAVLVALCVYAGYSLIVFLPRWFTLAIGLGIMALGVMVFIFLIKFLFEKSEEDVSDSIEVNVNDQPKLVDFIHTIAKDVGTATPKKIYITHDVNASVFYNSSFWSMFLPVRKNLKIGLGLVNALNVGEFKAVIAHEFGHFSQRSMKLGSFVYNVNRIIYNMLYKNTGYAESLNGLAQIHYIFFVCAKITVVIVQGIQWILQQMYRLVNLSYLGLSRQMEFHADLVAARASGSNNIVSSLQRIEFAYSCYQTTLAMYDKLWKEDKKATDIYRDHLSVIRHFAQTSSYKLEGDLPVLTEWSENNGEGKINITDQWASHPTTKERKEFLDRFDLSGPVNNESAWSLIDDVTALKKQLTEKIYIHTGELGKKNAIDNAAFEVFYFSEMEQYALPEVFSGYYDDRTIETFDTTSLKAASQSHPAFEELFTEEVKKLPKQIKSLEADIQVLQNITAGKSTIKTFDFHGKKYKAAEAADILIVLEKELKEKQELLTATDLQLAQFFSRRAAAVSAQANEEFIAGYEDYFRIRKEANEYLRSAEAILHQIQPLYEQTLANELIIQVIEQLKVLEVPFKKELQKWMDRDIFNNDPESKKKADKYLNIDYKYFSGTQYYDEQLEDLKFLIQNVWQHINRLQRSKFKIIAEIQAALF